MVMKKRPEALYQKEKWRDRTQRKARINKHVKSVKKKIVCPKVYITPSMPLIWDLQRRYRTENPRIWQSNTLLLQLQGNSHERTERCTR